MNPNRTYLYRSKAAVYTPAGRCALRLGLSAAALAVLLAGLFAWSSVLLHLKHGMGVPFALAGIVLAVWLAAYLILLPRSRRSKCSAPFVVYDAASARAWMLPTFAFTGDAAADAAAADALVDSEAFQQYPDLTQATATHTQAGWVLAGTDAHGMAVSHALSPRYRAIGDAPFPAGRGRLAANILCGVLLAGFLAGSLVWIAADKATEYRQMNACVSEVTALVAKVYPDYALDTGFQTLRPGDCHLHFAKPGADDDYLDAANYGRFDITIETDGGTWRVLYLSVSAWYTVGEDLAQPLALCRALDPAFDTLSTEKLAENWGDLQAQYDDKNRTEADVYETLARASESRISVFASLSGLSDYMEEYHNFPDGLKGYYYFDYNHYYD